MKISFSVYNYFFLTSEILASSQSLLVFERFEGKNFYHKQKILSGF